jgi:CheY-like chemotaxis protein
LHLPREPVIATTARAAKDIPTMPTILIIDDNEDLRETLVAVLEDEGYAILAAEDGVSGVDAYAAHHPDLVLTDLIMPKADGFDTIRRIRALDPQARILAMSGGSLISREDYLVCATALGAMFVLPKPFEIDQLAAAVAKCLNRPRNPDASAA